MIANGSFLLERGGCQSGTPAAGRARDRLGRQRLRACCLVEGSFVLGGRSEMPTIWDLLWRIPPLRWVAIQVGLAALLAALARAPRLGRPRPDPPSGADRPAEHAAGPGSAAGEDQSRKRSSRAARSLPPLAIALELRGDLSYASLRQLLQWSARRGGCLDPRRDFQPEGDS